MIGLFHSAQTQINSKSAAEILVRMTPTIKGIFDGQDHDLELVFDEKHFKKNLEVLDKL